MIVEVMGRRAGWIALYAGVAGGGDVILIPEIPYTLEAIGAKIEERRAERKALQHRGHRRGRQARRRGRRGQADRGRQLRPRPPRRGGIRARRRIERLTGNETRTVVLGHLQRGGSPTAYDRVLATQLGAEAVDLVVRGEFGRMVAVRGGEISSCPARGGDGRPAPRPARSPADRRRARPGHELRSINKETGYLFPYFFCPDDHGNREIGILSPINLVKWIDPDSRRSIHPWQRNSGPRRRPSPSTRRNAIRSRSRRPGERSSWSSPPSTPRKP